MLSNKNKQHLSKLRVSDTSVPFDSLLIKKTVCTSNENKSFATSIQKQIAAAGCHIVLPCRVHMSSTLCMRIIREVLHRSIIYILLRVLSIYMTYIYKSPRRACQAKARMMAKNEI